MITLTCTLTMAGLAVLGLAILLAPPGRPVPWWVSLIACMAGLLAMDAATDGHRMLAALYVTLQYAALAGTLNRMMREATR